MFKNVIDHIKMSVHRVDGRVKELIQRLNLE